MATPDSSGVSEMVSTLRASFNSGRTKTRKWRMGQLRAFQRMVQEGGDKMCAALKSDLHKSEFEGFIQEVNLMLHEVQHAIDHLDEWMQPQAVGTDILNLPGKSYIYKDPLGVACIIGAWNYPIQLTLLPLVGCIAAGNCALIKVPSDNYSPACSRVVAQLVAQFMDKSCFRVVEGDRHATTAVLEQRYDIIFFTGGGYVGRMVAAAAARNLTPTILELGGKSPAIVDRSADLDIAAKRLCWGAFMNSGQTCVRPDYVMVHRDVADSFIHKLKRATIEFYGQNAQETEFFGRLVNERAHTRVAGLLATDASYVIQGGEVDAEDKFVAPTLLDFGEDMEAFQNSASMSDEIFGPLLPILRYSSTDQVVEFITAREKPLGLYVFTTDAAVKDRVLRDTTSGGANVNDCIMHLCNPELPFGGVGMSGMGSYHGHHSFNSFSHHKSVLVKTNYLDVWARYPPYTPGKQNLFAVACRVIPARTMKLIKLAMMLVALLVVRQLAPSKRRVKAWLMDLAMKYMM